MILKILQKVQELVYVLSELIAEIREIKELFKDEKPS